MQLAFVLSGEVVRPDDAALKQTCDERPGPNERVDDMHACVTNGRTKLSLQHVFHGTDHVVHDRDRGVCNAERLRRFRQRLLDESSL